MTRQGLASTANLYSVALHQSIQFSGYRKNKTYRKKVKSPPSHDCFAASAALILPLADR
jgi:hypothetical protein